MQQNESGVIHLPEHEAYDEDDFTLVIETVSFRKALDDAGVPNFKDGKCFDLQRDLVFADGQRRTGRLHAALAFHGAAFSVTFRGVKRLDGQAGASKLAPEWNCRLPVGGDFVDVWRVDPTDDPGSRKKGFLFARGLVPSHIPGVIFGEKIAAADLRGLV